MFTQTNDMGFPVPVLVFLTEKTCFKINLFLDVNINNKK